MLSDEKGNYVYIINAKNEVERRDVKIGDVDDNGVTIAEGLSGSEAVVLSAGPFLNPGQKVASAARSARHREFEKSFSHEFPQHFVVVHPQPGAADRPVRRPDAGRAGRLHAGCR